MAVYYLYLLANYNVPKHGKEGKYGGQCRLPVNNKEGDMVDFQPVGEISNTGPSFICVGDDDDFMSAVNEFLGIVSIAHIAYRTI